MSSRQVKDDQVRFTVLTMNYSLHLDLLGPPGGGPRGGPSGAPRGGGPMPRRGPIGGGPWPMGGGPIGRGKGPLGPYIGTAPGGGITAPGGGTMVPGGGSPGTDPSRSPLDGGLLPSEICRTSRVLDNKIGKRKTTF